MDKLTRGGVDDTWDLRLNSVLWSLRVRPVKRLRGHTPLEAMFGVAPRVPILDLEEPELPDEKAEQEVWDIRWSLIQGVCLDVVDALDVTRAVVFNSRLEIC